MNMDKQHGKVEWSQAAIQELTQMWEKNECLYNPKHKFYHNKHARCAALEEMAEHLKVFNLSIGVVEVKNELQYLRGQYTRELAKVKERKSGAGVDEEHLVGSNWNYDLSFLHDYVQIRKGGCNLYDENSGRTEDSLDLSFTESVISPAQPSKRYRVSSETPHTSRRTGEEDSALAAATSLLEKIASEPQEAGNCKTQKFSEYIRAELDDIQNLVERDETMDKITMVILEQSQKRRMATQSFNFHIE